MRDRKARNAVIHDSRFMRMRDPYRPSGIKDIRAHRSRSEAPDALHMLLKSANHGKRKPSMPKMPWDGNLQEKLAGSK